MTHIETVLWIVTSAIWLFIAIRRIVRRDNPKLGWFLCAAYVPILVFWAQRILRS
jgi:hypothetical protein